MFLCYILHPLFITYIGFTCLRSVQIIFYHLYGFSKNSHCSFFKDVLLKQIYPVFSCNEESLFFVDGRPHIKYIEILMLVTFSFRPPKFITPSIAPLLASMHSCIYFPFDRRWHIFSVTYSVSLGPIEKLRYWSLFQNAPSSARLSDLKTIFSVHIALEYFTTIIAQGPPSLLFFD